MKIDHKIPPPIIASVFALIIWLSSNHRNAERPNDILLYTAFGLFSLGLIIAVASLAAFRKASTTINPLKPEKATALVTSGIYRFSRNPMYISLTLLLASWAIYFVSFFSLLSVIAFVIYIHRFQILPEERMMLTLFGDKFEQYTQEVRRWL